MVVYSYYPLGETRVQREAEALVQAGMTVDVICPRGPGETSRDSHRGVEIYRVPMRIWKSSLLRQLLGYLLFGVLAGLSLTRHHLRSAYRTIQVHNLPDFLVFSALVPKLMGVSIILDLHDLMPEFFEGRFGGRGGAVGRAIRWQEKMSCRFADHVIVVSDHWRETLRSRGVPYEKSSVVMNVADERIFRPVEAGRPSGEAFRLFYHGTVTYRYGLDLAIEAMALLRNDIPIVRLVIIGKGDLMDELPGLCQEFDVADIVELRNELVMAEDLPEIIARADLGIVPYRNDVFTDGLLPTKLMEYAAMELPCVAARTTAIERYFAGTMVAFFEAGSADSLAEVVRDLYRSPDRIERLKAGADEFNRRHNWSTVGAAYVDTVLGLPA